MAAEALELLTKPAPASPLMICVLPLRSRVAPPEMLTAESVAKVLVRNPGIALFCPSWSVAEPEMFVPPVKVLLVELRMVVPVPKMLRASPPELATR